MIHTINKSTGNISERWKTTSDTALDAVAKQLSGSLKCPSIIFILEMLTLLDMSKTYREL